MVFAALGTLGYLHMRYAQTKKAKVVEQQQAPANEAQAAAVEAKAGNTDKAELASLREQVASLQKQLEGIKKQPIVCAERIRQSAAPLAKKPNHEVMQAINQTGSNDDMILHMWTGRPAVIHELNAGKDDDQPSAADTGSRLSKGGPAVEAKNGVGLTKEEEEKELRLKDLAEFYRDRIRSNDSFLQSRKYVMLASTTTDPELKAGWRTQVHCLEEKIKEDQASLAKAEAELKKLSPEPASRP